MLSRRPLFAFGLLACHGVADLQTCPGGDTKCPATDSCCLGRQPDPFSVPGGFGCMPPNSTGTPGCAGGGTYPNGCCCAPGPSNISTASPNVLVIGDSVSEGYMPFLRAALPGVNIQHGPDNAGGGAADGSGYGDLCVDYFVRTPTQELPKWDVITYNFGIHDGGTSLEDYEESLEHITSRLVATGATSLLLVTTTFLGGSGADPTGDGEKHTVSLNEIATKIAKAHSVEVVDLHKTMEQCGDACKACTPHCGPEGYEYLVSNGLLPAVKAVLPSMIQL